MRTGRPGGGRMRGAGPRSQEAEVGRRSPGSEAPAARGGRDRAVFSSRPLSGPRPGLEPEWVPPLGDADVRSTGLAREAESPAAPEIPAGLSRPDGPLPGAGSERTPRGGPAATAPRAQRTGAPAPRGPPLAALRPLVSPAPSSWRLLCPPVGTRPLASLGPLLRRTRRGEGSGDTGIQSFKGPRLPANISHFAPAR